MSEPKLISPLLDGFSMGTAISNHDGVRCYPALKENCDKKYIVKIISIPASQTQLDALLLTGAYAEPTAALEYFRELADNVEKEAAAIRNLSRVEGFLSFEGWQVVPMEDRLGYEVYLLSSYRHALESYVRRNNMTHLDAVNLGIDICSALSAARRAGWIYVDLKPSNIFISENKEYRIGDLGLMELDGLDLAALPAKYRSAYTAPELQDDMLSPDTTLDTYALGVILYQIFNNGQLPQVTHPTEELPPPPVNADYEMAEIILKACDPTPANRWEDPVQMGQALVAYMQRNTVNDVPIIPPLAQIDENAEPADLSHPNRDETLPGMNDDQELTQENLSSEMSEMIAQADELISHELPAPPVAPEGTSLEQLEADVLKAAEEKQLEEERRAAEAEKLALEQKLAREAEEAAAAKAKAEQAAAAAAQARKAAAEQARKAAAEQAQKTAAQQVNKKQDADLGIQRTQKRRKGFLVGVILVLLLSMALAGGYLFYTNHYVQMISALSVTGSEDWMTVRLDTQIDDSLLTVVCTDTYGNTKLEPVTDGQANFSDLLPDMLYKIRVEIEGFHRLAGSTTHEYSTPAETRIASFTAATGPEDGTVILNFTVDGPGSEEWTAVCTTEGEDPIRVTFTGHMVNVNGLTLGKTYTISLEPTTELYIPGGNTLEFTASSIIIAENLNLSTDGNGALNVTWTAPEGAIVDSWSVRCYSAEGYDQTLTTDRCEITFEDISAGSAYTVEVTAAGMTQPARAGITANPIYITDVQVDAENLQNLKVSWTYEGTAPEGGWLLLYTIDGKGQQQVVQCDDSTGLIEVRVPSATYDFTIQAADGSTVFQNTYTYDTPDPEVYQNEDQAFYRRLHPHFFFVDMFKTPEKSNWTHKDVHNSMFTTTFASGDSVSVQLYYMKNFYIYREDIQIMYVIRDEQGNVLPDYIAIENRCWHEDMWNGPDYHYCCLEIPRMPTAPGNYTFCLYFDGMAVTAADFTITE